MSSRPRFAPGAAAPSAKNALAAPGSVPNHSVTYGHMEGREGVSMLPTTMPAEVGTLTELARLHDAHPGVFDPASLVAAWYERKAVLHARLAAEAQARGALGEATREAGYAHTAQRHADALNGHALSDAVGVAA